MTWPERLTQELEAARGLIRRVYGGEATDSPFAPLIAHQRDRFGLSEPQARLPEHFRGDWQLARVCFLGPHVMLVPEESAPGPAATAAEYIDYYRQRPERRDPYGHYNVITDGAPWLATELVHWPAEKEAALQMLKGAQGPAAVGAALDLTWAMLRESPVQVLVLTGNDALHWVLPRLGYSGGKLPGVTKLHGSSLGRFPLPGAAGRELTVVASVHWSKEMPFSARKLPGLADRTVREAVGDARRMIAAAVGAALG